MPVTTVVIVFVLASVGFEALTRRRRLRAGWPWFAAWAVAGFLSTFATVSFAIGLLVLPFAVAAVVAVSRAAIWPESLGFGAGVGVAAMVVAALNLGEPQADAYVLWLLAGVALLAASSAGYSLLAARGSMRRAR
jgi:uncharacterized membrane protein HdeD (DUF308 family)